MMCVVSEGGREDVNALCLPALAFVEPLCMGQGTPPGGQWCGLPGH